MEAHQNNNVTSEDIAMKKNVANSMQYTQLMQIFKNELKDIYWAEKALINIIPKMIHNASCEKLIKVLIGHLDETNQHVERLLNIFAIVGEKPFAKKCDIMEDLIEESIEIMESYEEGSMRDAGIILAIQKVEHYEIATYRSLCQFAKILDLEKAIPLLEATLKEEKSADNKLVEASITAIHVEEYHELI